MKEYIALFAFVGLIVVCKTASSNPSLAQSIEKTVAFFDKNQDGKVDEAELLNAYNTTDLNKDGCYTLFEHLTFFTSMGFSKEVTIFDFKAAQKAVGGASGSCSGIKVSALVKDFNTTQSMLLRSMITQVVINYCEDDSTRYLSIGECRQLPLTCQFSKTGCRNWACYNYIYITIFNRTGSFPFTTPIEPTGFFLSNATEAWRRFDLGVDLDADGLITKAEWHDDDVEEDVNLDGTTDRPEFLAQMCMLQCGGAGLSVQTVNNRYDIMTGIKPYIPLTIPKPTLPTTGSNIVMRSELLLEFNIHSLNMLCEEDRRNYDTNRDCFQLLRMCTESVYRTNPACLQYVENVITGKNAFRY